MRPILAALLCLPLLAFAHQHRSHAAKLEFQRAHPCPSTGKHRGACKGYVIDHVKALACGGRDAPENMQWQSVDEAKSKDKWERKGCGK